MIAIVISTLAGYLALARFLAQQLVVTGSILAFSYLLLLWVDGLMQGLGDDRAATGRWLKERVGQQQARRERLVLPIGLVPQKALVIVGSSVPAHPAAVGLHMARRLRLVHPALLRVPRWKHASIHRGLVLASMIVFGLAYGAARLFQGWLDARVLGALLLRNGGDGPWLLLGLAIGLIVVGVAIVVAKRSVTRAYLRIDGDSLERLDAFGGPKVIPRARIVSMQRCLLNLSGGLSSSIVPYLLLLDAQGRCVMRLRGQVWGTANIDTLQTVLRIPSGGSWDKPSGDTYRALRKRYPGSFAWWQANLTWLVVGVTVVGIVGGCVVYLYATGQVG